jgi:hypothetical protein
MILVTLLSSIIWLISMVLIYIIFLIWINKCKETR